MGRHSPLSLLLAVFHPSTHSSASTSCEGSSPWTMELCPLDDKHPVGSGVYSPTTEPNPPPCPHGSISWMNELGAGGGWGKGVKNLMHKGMAFQGHTCAFPHTDRSVPIFRLSFGCSRILSEPGCQACSQGVSGEGWCSVERYSPSRKVQWEVPCHWY